MPEFTLPGGRTVALQTFDRMAGARSWVTLGPVYSEDDRVVGIAATLRAGGVALYAVPRAWEQAAECACAADETH